LLFCFFFFAFPRFFVCEVITAVSISSLFSSVVLSSFVEDGLVEDALEESEVLDAGAQEASESLGAEDPEALEEADTIGTRDFFFWVGCWPEANEIDVDRGEAESNRVIFFNRLRFFFREVSLGERGIEGEHADKMDSGEQGGEAEDGLDAFFILTSTSLSPKSCKIASEWIDPQDEQIEIASDGDFPSFLEKWTLTTWLLCFSSASVAMAPEMLAKELAKSIRHDINM